MSTRLKVILWVLMTAGFIFGYAGLILPGQTAILETPRPGTLQFQRLHIFLFNLVCGGTLLLHYTRGDHGLSWREWLYLVLSLVFSVMAFLNQYRLAAFLAIILAVLVESFRIKSFGALPVELFQNKISLTRRFHHAALLCLSIGLLLSAGVILDDAYLHWLNLRGLLLDDFFLGFSFPLSLVTFAIIFSLVREDAPNWVRVARECSFWIVTVGVILFFVVIIFGIVPAELVFSTLLLADVVLIFYLFRLDLADRSEPADFLTSGMIFLVLTGVTGLLLVLWGIITPNDQHGQNLLLQTHAYLSLYGWNLAGFTVIVHRFDFPLRLNDLPIILLHWVTTALLAPLGSLHPIFAFVAIPAFITLTGLILLSRPSDRRGRKPGALPSAPDP
jgi:hypothetical protein